MEVAAVLDPARAGHAATTTVVAVRRSLRSTLGVDTDRHTWRVLRGKNRVADSRRVEREQLAAAVAVVIVAVIP